MWLGRVHPDHELIAEKIEHCDFVLVTHAHWDHVMDVPEVIHNTGAMALGSPNTCQLLAVCGVSEERIREIKVGDRLTLGHFRVEVSRAEHMRIPGFSPGSLPPVLQPPLRARDYRMDDNFSFLISIGGYRLLTDPGDRPAGAVGADVLFVSPRRDYAYYESLLRLVQPKVVVPNHWDDLFRPLSKPLRPHYKPPRWVFPPLQRVNLTEFSQMIEQIAPETKILIPEIFRAYDLGKFI
jgi:L-ascorbate metabolism protein UlaG (beta-lactamase superfamily)